MGESDRLLGADVVVDWIAGNAGFFPDKLATVDLASGRRRTYAEFDARVASVAGFLRSSGIAPGDRVAALAMNSTDLLEIMFACWRIGAIYLPLNFRLTSDELAFILTDAEPSLIFIDEQFAECGAVLQSRVAVDNWVAMDGLGGDTAFERALAAADPVADMIAQEPEDVCLIMYSSGTTGLPKGVTLAHGAMLFSVINTAPSFRTSHDMVGLTVMPLFHIGGTNAFSVPGCYLGATNIIARGFDPGATLAAIGDRALGVTHFFGVPAVFNAMKAHPAQPGTDFSRLELAASGAEAVPDALVRWWLDRGVVIQEVYGMTETCGGVCLLGVDDIPDRIGSAGKAFRHSPMKTIAEDGSDTGVGELGEICMRGPHITAGYWNRPEDNAACYVDGWFRSGDIGRIDADGYLFVEDRVKDMYISGGENVYPAEVENVLYEIEAIAEVAVIGVPDSRWGEAGCAVAALKPGASLTLADLRSHCEGKLARFKRPAHIALVDALPRTATGKVLKFELRKSVPAMLELF